jgi:hypothetical protein
VAAWAVTGAEKSVGGATVRGESAARVKARRWRAKGEPMKLSYFHSF